MFVRASVLVLTATVSVLAIPGYTVNQCNTGELQCCDNFTTASQAGEIPGLSGLEDMIGLNCNQIFSGVGGGASCTAQTACCTGTQKIDSQVIGLNCSPVSLSL